MTARSQYADFRVSFANTGADQFQSFVTVGFTVVK